MDSMKDGEASGSTVNKPNPHSYHHGRVPEAVHEVAREILESGEIETIGLRDVSRRIGVSASAMYRHFANKDELLASVAAQGFRELAASLESAANEPDPVTALGLAYVEFVVAKRGLFGLMFGRRLAQKEKHPALQKAALVRSGLRIAQARSNRGCSSVRARLLRRGASSTASRAFPLPTCRPKAGRGPWRARCLRTAEADVRGGTPAGLSRRPPHGSKRPSEQLRCVLEAAVRQFARCRTRFPLFPVRPPTGYSFSRSQGPVG